MVMRKQNMWWVILRNVIGKALADYHDCAVLYRTNAQSRLFEEKCLLANIPYKIVGGVNFYARKEIKDLLCYLKTVDNAADDLAVQTYLKCTEAWHRCNDCRQGAGLCGYDEHQFL